MATVSIWIAGGSAEWWAFSAAVAGDNETATAATAVVPANKTASSKVQQAAHSETVVAAQRQKTDTPQLKKVPTGLPQPALSQIVEVSEVGDPFKKRAEAAFRSVPAGVWKTLHAGGWKVNVAEFVVDAAPSLRGVQPRGWPAGSTWDNTDAVHLPSRRLLVFAEKRRTRSGDIVPSSRVESVFRHEVGHAFDRATGAAGLYQSAGASFMFAYHRDVTRMEAQNRIALNYYLQRGAAGRQEAFAEAFAILLGGGSDEANRTRFENGFPTVMRYVRKAVTNHDTTAASHLAQIK